MVVLSARFALLACLCAAIPLVHPVEAAHLHDRYSPPHHRTPGVPRAHGKHHGHKTPHQRAEQLPPLLRRHTVGDHKRVQNHHGEERLDNRSPHSAFSRSRHRRASGPYGRRSSIYVPGEHGDSYMVSKSQRKRSNTRTGTGRRTSHTRNRRQMDEGSLALGRIDIMGAAQQAGSAQRLASLMVDSTPIDWTSGDGSIKAFQLNASTTNQTQFIMVPTDEPSNAAAQGNFNKHVTLATEVFDANTAEMVMYCATYDPDPRSASTLLMTPCMDDDDDTQSATPVVAATDPCSNDDDDASDPHRSQIFSYDPSSGKIEPISASASSQALARCAGARVRRDNSNTTTGTSTTTPSRTSTSTTPIASASQQARNVTLVYVAGALELPASEPSASTTNGSGGQSPLFTTTITTTLVTTVTPGTSSRTATLAQAAVSVPLSSTPTPSPSTTTVATPTPSESVTASRSLSTGGSSSLVAPTGIGKTPPGADESLEVEIVGVTPSTTSSSSLTSNTASTTTTMTTTSSSPSSSLDADAVASSLSNSMAHSRRRAFGKALAQNAVTTAC